MKKLVQRIQEPTPKFFRKLRNIGLALTAVSGVIATAPVSLPALVVSVAGYLAVAIFWSMGIHFKLICYELRG